MKIIRLSATKFKGFFWSNLLGISIIALTKYFMAENGVGVLTFSEFIVIPILMGIISGWFWNKLLLPTRQVLLYSLLNSFIAIILSFAFLGEGVICLLIVSPLIFCFMLIGTLLSNKLRHWKNGRLNVSVILLLAVVFVADTFSHHNYENEVTDTIVINAPPAKVWQNVVAFKRINRHPKYWLFNIGLPNPIESTVTSYHKGRRQEMYFQQ